MNHIIDALNWRYATKKFDSSKKLSNSQYQELGEILRLTPSSFGLQPWKFVMVRNQEKKSALVEHSWGQGQVADCDVLVVLCRVDHLDASLVESYISDIVETRHIPVEGLE
jgi:nitroreductase